MSASARPGKYLVCDTDALLDLQIVLGPAALETVLTKLRDEFGVVCVLIEEIRDEIEDNARYDKAAWGTLCQALDRLTAAGLLVDPTEGNSPDSITKTQYRILGHRLSAHVGTEAYVHAFATMTHGTVLSRDAAADVALRKANLPSAPRIEAIDLLFVAHTENWTSAKPLIGGLRRLKKNGRLQRGRQIVEAREPEKALANLESRVRIADCFSKTDSPVLVLVRATQPPLSG